MEQKTWIDVEFEVYVRRYEVDTVSLSKLLAESKKAKGYTNEQVANILDKPRTLVEHWFRQDIYFAIPDEDIWYTLKDLLDIETDEFDKSVMTFDIRGATSICETASTTERYRQPLQET